VDLTSELASLFVFVALVLKLGFSKLWSLRQKTRTPMDKEAKK
jgi:MFS-type transporter involved in bile tolerance (Atg22 family)